MLILMKLEKCITPWSFSILIGFDFGTRISKCDSFILRFFIFIESNSSMRKNPEKPNKHVRKNRRSGKLAFFPPNLLTKDFIISRML